MHVVQENFHSLHLRQWEAARLHNEVSTLCDKADVDVTDYPALSAFLEAIAFGARVDDAANVTREITPGEPDTADIPSD